VAGRAVVIWVADDRAAAVAARTHAAVTIARGLLTMARSALAGTDLVAGVDDAIIMLGMLKEVLGRDPIAGCQGIARQRLIAFEDLRGAALDFHFRTGAFKCAGMTEMRPAAVRAAAPLTFRVCDLFHSYQWVMRTV